MVIFSNAKINIGLNIIEKRTDGFHNIESVFYPIGYKDVLEIIKADKKLSFNNTGIVIDAKLEDNLIIKAYNLIKNDYDIAPVKIHLHKTIPIGAGLGGGSSNAVYMLKLLNNFFELNINNSKLTDYARKIGSDCAFFVKNTPVFAFQKGDEFSEINIDLSGYNIVVIKPNVFVGTKEAYAGIVPEKTKNSLKEQIRRPIAEWKNNIKNDFEFGIIKKYPEIAQIKNDLYKQGAIYTSMSGSGSSVYGIFDKQSTFVNTNDKHKVWSSV